MSRRRRCSLSALLASLALLAMLPGPCGCLPEAVAAAEHGCCAPPEGVRAARPDCCATLDDVALPDAVTAASAPHAIAPAAVAVAWASPLVSPIPGRGQASPEPAVSPPLTVRRL